ncbi:N utilization substance protein B homolog [Mycoavidus cysteinexigens]|uniref:Transcription antitermination protein NusB n=1 Tax=Mycoavidus cysteinexigens TaxID=1553431 RepID=A0A2Z6ESC8_9BURK|nr:transcription antitermination factor NusB [Mycoavidus cysteinexigens]BBE08309.1 N utilization substance protein B homolog [Mycoavidus cysteinexigens]GAM52988.1 transcription termination protein NusB [bacterium endosymbiont of Mortierella elongata FMR23-6]GLR00815.1 N utilization substance protein B [Mycoavidus cysteinexigens]
MKSARRRSREFAVQGLYQWLLSGTDASAIVAQLQSAPGFGKADREHFDTLLQGVIRDAKALDTQLTPCIDRPSAELSPIEHAVLLIGAYELMHHIEIPYRVVINEAVEVTKTFGGTDGYKYVNGVLDKLAAQLRAVEIQPASR